MANRFEERAAQQKGSNRFAERAKAFEREGFFTPRGREEGTESRGRAQIRDINQPFLGALEGFTGWVDPGGIGRETLRELSEGDEDIIPEVAEAARQKSQRYMPTQRNLERVIEESTGLPLQATEAKHEIQRNLLPAALAVRPAVNKAMSLLQRPRKIVGGTPEVFPRPMQKQLTGPSGEGPPIAAEIGGEAPPTPGESLKPFLEGGEKFEGEFDVGRAIREAIEPPKPEGMRAPPNVPEQPMRGEPLSGRVQQEARDLGLRPPEGTATATLDDEIGQIISRPKFKDTTTGGRALKTAVMRLDNEAWDNVNDLYRQSREANEGIVGRHEDAVNQLQQQLTQLQRLRTPSAPQKELMNSIEDIIDGLAIRDMNGAVVDYIDVPNQSIIDDVQSLRQKIRYNFEHGDAKNIFKPTIAALQNSATRAAASNPAAEQALGEANNAYRNWAETFDNDYMRPIRDRRNQDFSKTYKAAQDLDEFNQIRNVLRNDPVGVQIENGILRDIVEKRLKPFIEKVRKGEQLNRRDFENELNELDAILSPEQRMQIENTIFRRSVFGRPAKKATISEAPKHPLQGLSEEQIARKADSISGLNELEDLLSKTPKGKATFEDVKEFKAADLLLEGKLHPSDKPLGLQKILQDREKVAYLNRTLGNERLNELRRVVDDAAKLQELFDAMEQAHIENVEKIANVVTWMVKAAFSPVKTIAKGLLTQTLKPKNLGALSNLAKSTPKNPAKMSREELQAFKKKFEKEFNDLGGETPQ